MTTTSTTSATHWSVALTIAIAAFLLAGCAGPKAAREPMPWEDPTYHTQYTSTQAVSRPEPGKSGWNLWLRHSRNRARWVTEREVDLLFVGDSIVFQWGRRGKDVWKEHYEPRNAVNIGSSGDQTKHMLWHFQNGGLTGMKDRNPKVVVMMIGTNNRGNPELEGADTAYGILALLKELHHQLPKSKILLLAIFPRGDTPTDKGRIRNDQINKIIRTYADNQTVYWLDIGHVFLDENGNMNRDLMPDRLHPSVAGYQAWVKAMEPTLAKLLAQP
jgi:lysophospholipase L1-like esterase